MLIMLQRNVLKYIGNAGERFGTFFSLCLIVNFSKPIQFSFCKYVGTKGGFAIYWLRLEM